VYKKLYFVYLRYDIVSVRCYQHGLKMMLKFLVKTKNFF